MKLAARSSVIMLGCLGAGLAQAHAKLVSADPMIGGVARATPRRLDLTFSEAISGKLSGAVVTAAGGKPLPATASVGKTGKSLSLALAAPLKPGVYAVAWHAVASDDGHRTSGAYTFTVR